MEVDRVMHSVLPVRIQMPMRKEAVSDLRNHLARLGHTVVEHKLQRRMKDHVGSSFAPAPNAALSHLGATVIGRTNLPLSSDVDSSQPFEPARGLHRPLNLLRTAKVDHHRLSKHVDAVLV